MMLSFDLVTLVRLLGIRLSWEFFRWGLRVSYAGLGAFNNAVQSAVLDMHCLSPYDDDALDKLQKIYMHKPHPVCQLIETESLPQKE